MHKFIVMGIGVLIQTTVTIYFISILTEGLENKKYNIRQKIATMLLVAFGGTISTYITFPSTILKVLTCSLPTLFALTFILKVKFIKSVLITIGTILSFAITELSSMFIFAAIFKCSANDIMNNTSYFFTFIILQNLLILILIKLSMFLIAKFTKLNTLTENINSSQILSLILLISACILPKILIRALNYYDYPTSFLVLSVIETVVMGIAIFVFFKRTVERDKAQSELLLSEMHNKTMVGMVDGVRTLKHDYNNIMQALSGYVSTKQYDKLEEHIKKVLQECNVVNNFSVITPELFNEPAIYGIMGAKYFLAVDKDITVDLDVTCDFTKICFSMPELSRILGILLDNAMEATEKAKQKYIRFEAKYDKRKNADVIKVINTYDTSINIDLDKIYEKGVSSKKVKSGIGLWEVKKLVKKNKSSQIFATIEGGKFVQNLIIERLVEFEEADAKDASLIPISSEK